jgi:hypothetical protein
VNGRKFYDWCGEAGGQWFHRPWYIACVNTGRRYAWRAAGEAGQDASSSAWVAAGPILSSRISLRNVFIMRDFQGGRADGGRSF